MYVPEQVITNQYFNEQLGEDVDGWLRENVQIFERRWTNEDESTADLAEKAALQALERANITAQDLDLIIISTDTPEFVSPSTSSILQHRLNATKAGTFDVNTACAGFVTCLDMASKYIKADSKYEYVLVIGAYNMSKYLNKADKKTVTLFADGAGAVILKAEKEGQSRILASKLETKGEYNEWMGIYSGGSKNPVNQEVIEAKTHQLQFVKKFPKELNQETWTRMILELCEEGGVKPEEVSRYFITQININSIFETMDNLKLPHDKAEYVMHNYGYTGSACIPMAFNQAAEQNKIKRGDYLIFVGSGGGLSFAACLLKY